MKSDFSPGIRWGIWLLEHCAMDPYSQSIAGDCQELYFDRIERRGRMRTFFWLWGQVARSLLQFAFNSLSIGVIMFKNYFKIAFRTIQKHFGYSLINMLGLAIGMAVCILILLWVQHELSFDRFHEKSGSLYRVVEIQAYSDGDFPVAVTPGPLANTLKTEFPEIENAMRVTFRTRLMFSRGDVQFYENSIRMADPSILEMMDFPLVAGDKESALKELQSIVLTRSMAEKYFGNEDPMGQTIRVQNQYDLTVTGVLEEIPANSHLKFDFLMPFEIMRMAGRNLENWGNNSFFTYIELNESADAGSVEKKITNVIQEHNEGSVTTLHLQPLTRIHLHSDYVADIAGHGDIKYVYIFSIIAVFVLLIACINFINLTTARSGNRAREVGMRKVTGALRKDIASQFLGESLMLTFWAFILALIFVVAALPLFSHLAGKNLSLDVVSNWMVPLGLVATVIVTGLISGSYPAFYLSSFQPVKVLRGGLSAGAKRAGFRRLLVIVQFALSIFLIIATSVIYDQLNYIQNKEIGFDREHLLSVKLGRGDAARGEAIKSALLQNAMVESATICDVIPTNIMSSSAGLRWPGRDPEAHLLFHQTSVGYDYFKTFGMEMVMGRPFTREFTSDTSGFIVNETGLALMNLENPIGTPLEIYGNEGPLIGVVKDFHFKSLTKKVEPMMIFYSSAGDLRNLVVRLTPGNVSDQVAFVESVWERFMPGKPFEYFFVDDAFDELYRSEERMGGLFRNFTGLGIFIACMGLMGLAAFIAEQRTKEIGIRKVLGASISGIIVLVSREFLVMVTVSNLIAWPLAWYFMSRWLENYAYHASLSWMAFVGAGLIALAVALITVSVQAFRAARANPVNSLRYE